MCFGTLVSPITLVYINKALLLGLEALLLVRTVVSDIIGARSDIPDMLSDITEALPRDTKPTT